MKSFWEVPIIVVDVETTGHDAEDHRIMEIACVVIQGGEIVKEYSELINPHQFIPPFIEQMTGISNAMAATGSEAHEIMPTISEMLAMPGAIFAAHNVSFDWNFIQRSLRRLNLSIPLIPQLCTCKLARRILPMSLKKNVGAVASHFGIEIKNRHRALGDAKATALFLLQFLESLESEYDIETIDELLRFQNKRIEQFHTPPAAIKRVESTLAELPDEPGVYKMLDKDNNILYVGKAKNLKERVRSYFQAGAQHPQKIARMVKQVHAIHHEVTGTELAALLLESKEIKRIKPQFNTASKKMRRFPFLRLNVNDPFPRLEWSPTIMNDGAEYFGPFRSGTLAREVVETVYRSFGLRQCTEMLRPSVEKQPCFYHQIKRCGAPCAEIQSREEYLQEVDRARHFLSGSGGGLLERMEEEMLLEAEALRFENATMLRNRLNELRRLFDRRAEVSTSVTHNNTIIILDANSRDKTIEVFFIKAGKLAHQEIIGRKADLSRFHALMEELYYTDSSGPVNDIVERLDPIEVDEIQIITSWIHRHSTSATILYAEHRSSEKLKEEFSYTIRNTHSEINEIPSEYNQLSCSIDD
ncbi:MAG: DEDD exonuclease domain-containing protein [Ignavibacteriae bacterium]|jgi:DNA polymerase-3 subunit epsilon|nr:DEDD exonuclease domain-containing protein [Ignavibacteriota bacterium]